MCVDVLWPIVNVCGCCVDYCGCVWTIVDVCGLLWTIVDY